MSLALHKLATNSRGIIITGSSYRINDPTSPKIPDFILKLKVPILAICYGFECIAKKIGTFPDNKLHYYNKMIERVMG